MLRKLIILATFILALGSFSYAEDIQWVGGGADNLWSTPENWDLGQAPTLADEVRIDVPAAEAPGGPLIQDGIDAKAHGIFTEAAGEPTLTMTGGTLDVAHWIWWGDGQNSFAVWTMSGGTVTVAEEFELGWGGGAGTLIMTGGTISAGEAVIPTGSGAYGQLNLNGGTYNVTKPDGLDVNATGMIDITEGTLVLEGDDTAKVNDLVAAGQITAYGGEGQIEVDFDLSNPGKTTVTAVAPAPKPAIAWVSYHAADDEPHADAAAAGFTMAPDIGYTDLLKANGYDVTRVLTSQTPDVEYLNTFDLVIISRTASSGHYSGSGATLWNSITAPMINLNGYTLRSSRLGFTDGTDMPDTTGDIRLAVTDPTHPIFAGIPLTDGVMDNIYAEGAVPLPPDPSIISRGISINNNNLDEEGTVLATVAEVSADTGPVGGMVIAELPAGATLQNSSGSPDDVLGGPRLVFLTGSREPSGVTGGQAAALYDLYPDGEQMFLNAVKYMIPVVPADPGTDGLVAYYALENDATDSSGNGLDGVIVGDPIFVEGEVGMGLQLDGIDDYVDFGNPDMLNFGTGDWAVCAWIKTTQSGTGDENKGTIFANGGDQSGGKRYTLCVGEQDEGYVTLTTDDDSTKVQVEGSVLVNDDVWHHVVGMRSGTDLLVYIDGVLSGNNTTPDGYDLSGTSQHNAYIGVITDNRDGTLQKPLGGSVDDVRIYNRALSEAEIRYLAGERAPYIYDGGVLDDMWSHDDGSDEWDESGIGESNPGGVSSLIEDGITFLRIQDTGDPRDYGISDPGSNRKIYLGRSITADTVTNPDRVLDGVTVEFRARVATTGPLDDLHPDGGVGHAPWPVDGDGYVIHDGGKGNVSIRQSDGDMIISFALALASDDDELSASGLVMNKLNGASPSGDVDIQGDEPGTLNILELDPTQWHTYLIRISPDATGVGTHLVQVYLDGSDTSTDFIVTAGTGDDFDGSYLAIGLGATPQSGAVDFDYVAVQQ